MFTSTILEQYRQETDKVADDVVASIINTGQIKSVSELFQQIVRTEEPLPNNLPSDLVNYFHQNAVLPTWADDKKITIAENFFWSYGREIMLLLLCKSLPTCYVCSNGAQVLYHTGRLISNTGHTPIFTRRLMETMQFVINTMYKGGLTPQGKGIYSVLKVRLMHAAIRHFLLQSGEWKNEFGKPINQEDMAITMLSFGYYIIEGLEKINIKASEQEKEAFIHTWNVIGSFMGIKKELLPANYEQAALLGKAILQHQAAPSDAGKQLTYSCIDFLKYILPGNHFDQIIHFLFRYFIGNSLADMLDVPVASKSITEIMPTVMIDTLGIDYKLQHESVVMQIIFRHFNIGLLQGVTNYFNHYKQTYFYIPPDLKQNWAETATWQDIMSSPSVAGYRVSVQKKNNKLQ